MKLFCKTNLIVFVFLAAMLVVPALSQADNLIQNPGFEEPVITDYGRYAVPNWWSDRGDGEMHLTQRPPEGEGGDAEVPGPIGNQAAHCRWVTGEFHQVVENSGWTYGDTFVLRFNATDLPGNASVKETEFAVDDGEVFSVVWDVVNNLEGIHPGGELDEWTQDMEFEYYIHPVDFPVGTVEGSDVRVYFRNISWDEPYVVDNVYLGLLPVALTANPESQEVVLGDPVEFAVGAVADEAYTISYQWYYNDEPLAGEESDTLFIAAVQGADAGDYYCEVTFDDGVDEIVINSAVATLEVDLLAEIITQPQSLVRDAGEDAEFWIEADPNNMTLEYQWYWSADGEIDTEIDAPIGQDANSVTIENVQVDPDEGYYYCEVIVDDGFGNTGYLYSDMATLGIRRKVGYWTFDAADFVDGVHLDSSDEERDAYAYDPASVVFVDGVLGDALAVDAIGGRAAHAGTQSPAEITGQMSVSAWVNWDGANNEWQGIISKRSQLEGSQVAEFWMQINPAGDSLNINSWAGSGIEIDPPATDQWVHLGFSVDEDGAKMFFNGLLVGEESGFVLGNPDSILVIGCLRDLDGEAIGAFNGAIDDVRIYNHALDEEAFNELYFELADVTVVEHPQDQAAFPGESAEFSVEALGDPGVTLSYQWYRSDDDTITPDTDAAVGTDSNSLVVDNIQTDPDEGYYYCVISPGGNGIPAVSNTATLGVKRLKAHWTLDEADYDWFEYLDQSGEGYDLELWAGIFDDPDWIDGIVGDDAVPMAEEQGWAQQPDGTDPYDFAEMTGMFTVSAWINWDGSEDAPSWQMIVNQQEHGAGWGATATSYMRFAVNDGDLVFGSPPAESSVRVEDAVEADGQWQYVVATYDGDQTGRVYVNGELAGENTFFFGSPVQEFHLGGVDNNGTIEYFNGAMDEVRVYNYELDAISIGQTYTDVTGQIVCADPPPAFLDLYEDCVIDTRDLAVLVGEWLESGFYGWFEE